VTTLEDLGPRGQSQSAPGPCPRVALSTLLHEQRPDFFLEKIGLGLGGFRRSPRLTGGQEEEDRQTKTEGSSVSQGTPQLQARESGAQSGHDGPVSMVRSSEKLQARNLTSSMGIPNHQLSQLPLFSGATRQPGAVGTEANASDPVMVA